MKAEDWIKVEDRLPEQEEGFVASKVVLVRHCDGSYNIAFYSYRKNDNCWFNPMICELMNITHWQEIVPPKED